LLGGLITALALPALAVPLSAGKRAPAFTRPDLDGRLVSSSVYRGKLVLLDFWASWCAPCIVEIPHLTELQKHYSDRLQVIGVSMDEKAQSAKKVVTTYRINYPIIMADAAFGKRYGDVLGLPEIYLIGRDGKIIKSWRGEFRQNDMDATIEAALSR
jgi:peroxiredoxin